MLIGPDREVIESPGEDACGLCRPDNRAANAQIQGAAGKPPRDVVVVSWRDRFLASVENTLSNNVAFRDSPLRFKQARTRKMFAMRLS